MLLLIVLLLMLVLMLVLLLVMLMMLLYQVSEVGLLHPVKGLCPTDALRCGQVGY